MSEFTRFVTDMVDRPLKIPLSPKRIISLVPSQTELLYDIGITHRMVGVTKFCVHPKDFTSTIPKVGGTKNIDIDIIRNLNPDLIIANKEENKKDVVDLLQNIVPVYVTDVNGVQDAFDMILKIGSIVARPDSAYQLTESIKRDFKQLEPLRKPKTAVYLIWNNPIMTVAGNTYIGSLLRKCGFKNLFESSKNNRYPSIEVEKLQEMKPDVLFLSTEPFKFNEKHVKIYQELLPDTEVCIVDGELFSWYGSRMRYAPGYLNKVLTPFRD
ncbi:MAG: ABC-type Fe3+-hydroxamate transport system substrate-binding protein [Sphingobacteriales bacterium]|jgi:ABC-type Fe3+-hydroxamate transport system substrate-binding protein